MFYLFILESIGTAELLLIGLVALIVFGPRKLPEFARMLGKARKEFKRTTSDFKETWEREVNFEGIDTENEIKPSALAAENIRETRTALEKPKNEVAVPVIKEVSQTSFQENPPAKDALLPDSVQNGSGDKREWL